MVNENTRVCSLRFENGKKTSPFDWLSILPFQKKKKRHRALPWNSDTQLDAEPVELDERLDDHEA